MVWSQGGSAAMGWCGKERTKGRGANGLASMVLAWARPLKAMQSRAQDNCMAGSGWFCPSVLCSVQARNLNECIWIHLGSRYFRVTSILPIANICLVQMEIQSAYFMEVVTCSWTEKSFWTFADSKFDCGQRLNVENSIMCSPIWFSVIFVTRQYVAITYYYCLIIVLKYFVKMAIKCIILYLESVLPSHEEQSFSKNYRLGTFHKVTPPWLYPCFVSVACSMPFEAQEMFFLIHVA